MLSGLSFMKSLSAAILTALHEAKRCTSSRRSNVSLTSGSWWRAKYLNHMNFSKYPSKHTCVFAVSGITVCVAFPISKACKQSLLYAHISSSSPCGVNDWMILLNCSSDLFRLLQFCYRLGATNKCSCTEQIVQRQVYCKTGRGRPQKL